jgi:hypothetical protein
MKYQMKQGIKHITGIIFFLFISFFSISQVTLKAVVDKNKILIGEPVTLTLEAYVPLGQQFNWISMDTLPHFEILEKGKIDTTQSIESKNISQLITITSFDSGQWEIPPFEIMVNDKSYLTDSILMNVAFSAFDPSADYRDIKNIEDLINPLAKYIPWLIAVAAIVSFVLISYFMRRHKLAGPPLKAPVSRISPFDEAMQALAELKKKGLHSVGHEKEFYTELNNILRVFVLRKLGISTFEKTNEELITELKQVNLPGDSFDQLSLALRMSDFVKFAKYQPGATDNETNYEVIRSAIQSLNNIE